MHLLSAAPVVPVGPADSEIAMKSGDLPQEPIEKASGVAPDRSQSITGELARHARTAHYLTAGDVVFTQKRWLRIQRDHCCSKQPRPLAGA